MRVLISCEDSADQSDTKITVLLAVNVTTTTSKLRPELTICKELNERALDSPCVEVAVADTLYHALPCSTTMLGG